MVSAWGEIFVPPAKGDLRIYSHIVFHNVLVSYFNMKVLIIAEPGHKQIFLGMQLFVVYCWTFSKVRASRRPLPLFGS